MYPKENIHIEQCSKFPLQMPKSEATAQYVQVNNPLATGYTLF